MLPAADFEVLLVDVLVSTLEDLLAALVPVTFVAISRPLLVTGRTYSIRTLGFWQRLGPGLSY